MAYKVFINPGHAPNGQPDAGACYHGLRESDINFSVGEAVTEELIKRGYDVKQIQDDNLNMICHIANKTQANLFVSLHCNAVADESVSGTEVWLHSRGSNATNAATKIVKDISEALGINNRGVKYNTDRKDNLCVLSDTAMPAMLVEMFFISNENDVRKMKDGFQCLVNAICNGIDFYFV